MKLAQKLFLSHFLVAFVSVIVIMLFVIAAAPRFVISQTDLQLITPATIDSDTIIIEQISEQNEDIIANPFGNLLIVLVVAGGISVLIAGIISWWMARRIVIPLKTVAIASTYIAEGHYAHRLPVTQSDELGLLAQQFNEMAQALDAVETTRRQLLADISHELKTPLATIKGYMEGFEDGVIPANGENFTLVGQEVSRLQRLVHDMHDVSRTEAGFHALQVRPYDSHTLINQVVASLRPQFDGKGVSLNINLPPDLSPVRLDPERIKQVMVNMLGNALQYTATGGDVCVSVERDDDKNMMLHHIKDSGLGIAPDDLKYIFQRFYRVDKSRARISGGSGIGLTIAKAIVEAHGGRISAMSDGLNTGTTFTFTLPLAE